MRKLSIKRLFVADQPFAHTVVDYFGQVLVKLNKKTLANEAVAKRYGAIFTWVSSRPLHMELARDLSTDSFVLALRRFISKIGYP